MHETPAELDELQRLLDKSLAGATNHLRSIVKPGERSLDAAQLCAVLTGMCTLSLATVTANGEPRISAVDGHFWHGSWIFGTDRSAAKAKHLDARPGVSISHLRGEDLGVFAHGTVEDLIPPGGPPADDWPRIDAHLTEHYGESPTSLGDTIVYWRLRPSWMVAYAPDPAALLS